MSRATELVAAFGFAISITLKDADQLSTNGHIR
jgi:hypothetical protein